MSRGGKDERYLWESSGIKGKKKIAIRKLIRVRPEAVYMIKRWMIITPER